METKFTLSNMNHEVTVFNVGLLLVICLLMILVALIDNFFWYKANLKKMKDDSSVEEKEVKKQQKYISISFASVILTMLLCVCSASVMSNSNVKYDSKLNDNMNTVSNTLNLTENQADDLARELVNLTRKDNTATGYPIEVKRTYPNDDGTSRQIVIVSNDQENNDQKNFTVLSDANLKNTDLAAILKDK